MTENTTSKPNRTTQDDERKTGLNKRHDCFQHFDNTVFMRKQWDTSIAKLIGSSYAKSWMKVVDNLQPNAKGYRNVSCAAAKWVHAVLSTRRARQNGNNCSTSLRVDCEETLPEDTRMVDVFADEHGGPATTTPNSPQ